MIKFPEMCQRKIALAILILFLASCGEGFSGNSLIGKWCTDKRRDTHSNDMTVAIKKDGDLYILDYGFLQPNSPHGTITGKLESGSLKLDNGMKATLSADSKTLYFDGRVLKRE